MTDAHPRPVRVVTYNTAVGNPRIKTRQRDFLELPFYQDVIQGRPDAPLFAGQEIGPEQAQALKEAARNGKFEVIHKQRPGQGNVVLVPKRFEVLERQARYFLRSQLAGAVRSLWRWLRRQGRPNWRQLAELRIWIRVRVRDRESGRVFSFFNTHLSGDPVLRLEQAKELFGRVRDDQRDGPVIVAGDLNTRTAETAIPGPEAFDSQVRALFDGLEDMGLSATERRKSNIDYVLASGFSAIASKVYTGDSLSLPGLPNAESISDHYAEEDVLRFA